MQGVFSDFWFFEKIAKKKMIACKFGTVSNECNVLKTLKASVTMLHCVTGFWSLCSGLLSYTHFCTLGQHLTMLFRWHHLTNTLQVFTADLGLGSVWCTLQTPTMSYKHYPMPSLFETFACTQNVCQSKCDLKPGQCSQNTTQTNH